MEEAMRMLQQNPQMMQTLQAAMSNPEVQRLMAKPGLMAKFQAMQSNPAQAQFLMQDPDIQELTRVMGGAMGGGGGGGFGGGMGGGAFGGGGVGGGGGGGDHVIKIHSTSEFDSQLRLAGDKLVVVDWTASWCGPCQRVRIKSAVFSGSHCA